MLTEFALEPDTASPPSPITCAFDLWSVHARELLDMPAGWQVYRSEWVKTASGDAVMLDGAVAPPFTRGPRKGRANWDKRDPATERKIIMSAKDHDAWVARWEVATGKCGKCVGRGDVAWSWSKAEGSKRKACGACGGTGTAKGVDS